MSGWVDVEMVYPEEGREVKIETARKFILIGYFSEGKWYDTWHRKIKDPIRWEDKEKSWKYINNKQYPTAWAMIQSIINKN